MTLATGNNSIDALVYSSWNADPHSAAALRFSFLRTVPGDAEPADAQGFAPMSAAQQNGARAALAVWAAVAKLSFTEVAADGDIVFGTNDQSADNSAGYAYFPSAQYQYSTPLYLNNRAASSNHLEPGQYGFTVLVHEIGHTLGLKHPGSYGAASGTEKPPFLPAATDNRDYTQMSYNDAPSYDTLGLEAITPMLYDIQAIQYLYGANLAYHAGADSYAFTTRSAPQCIWDGGGFNTFDFSACALGATVDLHAGSFSSTASDYHNVSIAYGVTIQAAIGGGGNDSFVCNDAGDTIDAGGGNDVLISGAGDDHLTGGGGADIVRLAGAASAYVLFGTADGWLVDGGGAGTGRDLLSGIEEIDFGDAAVLLAQLPTLAKPLADQTVFVGQNVQFALAAGSFAPAPGMAAPTLVATLASGKALPAWLNFDPASGRFSGTPTAADSGALTVRVSASDSHHVRVADDFSMLIAASSQLTGGAGDDRLTAGPGDDVIDGGAGRDVVSYVGARANYTINAVAGGFNVRDLAGDGGSDSLTQVERLSFADAAVALDIGGVGGQVYRLYSVFNRAPDLPGLGFWIAAMDHGLGLTDAAQGFFGAPEFQAAYGAHPSHGELVERFYENILHRPSEKAGFDFWVGLLDRSDLTPAQVLVNFCESGENQANLIGLIGNGFTYLPFG